MSYETSSRSPSRKRKHSVSSSDGSSESDAEDNRKVKSSIQAAVVKPPTSQPTERDSSSPRESQKSRSRSKSHEKDAGAVSDTETPDWQKDRSWTPDDQRKSRKWRARSPKRRKDRYHDRDRPHDRDDERRDRDRYDRDDERRDRDRYDRDSRYDRDYRRRYDRKDRYDRRDRYDNERDRDDYRRDARRDIERRKGDRENSTEHEKSVDKENIDSKAPIREKKKKEEILTTKTGGAYIPPARLRMMQQAITDKSSVEYQRMSWEALKKSINGLVNKINVGNIKEIILEIFGENVIRGRGLLCRSVIQAQAASPTFTHVYAALVAIINSKFPQIGELLLKRLILQFRRGYRRNDKSICLSATQFIAHLVNQQVAHEVIALEILTLLLEKPSDDSVEIAVGFMKECGSKLTELSPRGVNAIFERMRNILHEAEVTTRVQYMIEVMFQVRKDKFKDHVSVMEALELVEEDDQFTHMITLDDATNAEDMLNVFREDPDFLANEEKYKELKNEIVDSSDSEDGGSGSDADSSSSDGEDEEEKQKIIDETETNLVGLRRTIYLTLQSSLDYEEAAHKLLKLQLKPGQESELCNMVLDCGAQQRTYEKFYGLLAQRFCMLDKKYVEKFEEMFMLQYETCHRLDPTKLRNVSKFFGHLLHSDAISWGVLQVIKMNEDETTSSSRIFVKQLFLELAEYLGLPKLNERLKDETLAGYFEGIMPRDHPKKTRFAINFFTSIGLGGLTDGLREHLKNMPKPSIKPIFESSSDSSSSSSSSSSSDSSDSDSD